MRAKTHPPTSVELQPAGRLLQRDEMAGICYCPYRDLKNVLPWLESIGCGPGVYLFQHSSGWYYVHTSKAHEGDVRVATT